MRAAIILILFLISTACSGAQESRLPDTHLAPQKASPARRPVAKVASSEPLATPTDSDTPTLAEFLLIRQDIAIFGGPGAEFDALGWLEHGQTLMVIEISAGGDWWRVVCPIALDGACWLPNDPLVVQPASAPVGLPAPEDSDSLLHTPVRRVEMLAPVRIRNGPGTNFSEIGLLSQGQTAIVTGLSPDRGWWRVLCPDKSVGSCWISADERWVKVLD